jgi:DNA-binding MarR family transcriptional regulator
MKCCVIRYAVFMSTTQRTDADVIDDWRERQRTYLATAANLDRALEQNFDLGLSEFEILDLVWESNTPECTMRDIVDLTPMTQSALSRVVDRLARAGLLKREECTTDRRSMFVALTHDGKAVHSKARKVYRDVLDSELSRASD